MSHIHIQHVGPLKEVDIDLKKINIFIGPQSSGKSTLVKVICFCKWVEKRALTTIRDELLVDVSSLFEDQLLTFHRLEETYFNSKSYFSYKSEYIFIEYKDERLFIERLGVVSEIVNERKVIYIPAERNIVSALPDVTKYSDQSDNFLNFIYDWSEMKRHYTPENELNILNLGVKYHYAKEGKRDNIVLQDNRLLSLQNASSGVQAIVPLILLFDYLSDKLFSKRRVYSLEQRRNVDLALKERGFDQLDTTAKTEDAIRFMQSREYHFTQFFIEEPEQNLFPYTQKCLIEHLLKACYKDGREHELFLTTHSPYVLFTVNNAILASQLKDHEKDLKDIPAVSNPIKPKEVGLWAVKNGELEDLQDDDGMLRDNYFDDTMRNIMNEHQNMLSYFDEE